MKSTKPNGFTYHARFSEGKTYYNQEKDDFLQRLREVREQAESDDLEDRKARIRRKLNRRNALLADKKYRQQKVMRSNIMLLVIIVGLVLVTFAVLDIYLPKILKFLGV